MTQADRWTINVIYFSIRSEGRRIFCSRKPNLRIDILTTTDFWRFMGDIFFRLRNITFDRYTVLTAKQTNINRSSIFMKKLKELLVKWELGNNEITLKSVKYSHNFKPQKL